MGKLENAVERYLDEQVKILGGVTRKFTSPGHTGVADRLCFLPKGILFLVEVKTGTGKETSKQERERERMLNLGFSARVAYGKTGVDEIIKEMKGLINGIL